MQLLRRLIVLGGLLSLVLGATISRQTCGKLDIVLVVDNSGSVAGDFHDELLYLLSAISVLHVAPDATHIGAISYNKDAKLEFNLLEYNSISAILDLLNQIKQEGGSTNVVSAFDMALDEMKRHGRPDANKVMLIISDGHSQNLYGDLVTTLDRVRASGAVVYVATQSKDYSIWELNFYADNPDRLFLNSVVPLKHRLTKLARAGCTGSDKNTSDTLGSLGGRLIGERGADKPV